MIELLILLPSWYKMLLYVLNLFKIKGTMQLFFFFLPPFPWVLFYFVFYLGKFPLLRVWLHKTCRL